MPPKRLKWKQTNARQKSIVDEDIISDLPRNVIDCILGNMPIRDAVRTSVLSKKWRFYYLTIPQLVFDKTFCRELYDFIKKRCAPICSGFEFKHLLDEIITKSLMLHPGGVEEFTVWIPYFNKISAPDVNKWILYLSQKNIKKLTLEYKKDTERQKLPPYFFSCLDLTFLELWNYVLSPPLEFKGFLNLNQLILRWVDFANNCFESLISSCPVLNWLELYRCSSIRHFNISSSKLKGLQIEADKKFESVSLENAPNLTKVFFTLESVGIGLGGNHISDLVKFVGSLLKVKILGLNGKFLQFLATGTPVPRVLSPMLDSLLFLELTDVNFMALDEISAVVCLIRSARNLQELHVEASTVEINREHVSGYLELQDCENSPLNKLHFVKLTKISGFDPEFEFIRFLLFSAPSLMKMSIVEHPNLDADIALDLARKLLLLQPPSAVSIDFSRKSKT